MNKVITKEKSIPELMGDLKEQAKELKKLLTEQESTMDLIEKQFSGTRKLVEKLERKHCD